MEGEDRKLRVVIYTSRYRISGEITLPAGTRLTDHIAHSKPFFAVTDAEVIDHNGNSVISGRFINIHRDSVELLLPDEPANILGENASDFHTYRE